MNEDALRALVRETIARVQSRGPQPVGDAPQQLVTRNRHVTRIDVYLVLRVERGEY